MPLFHVIESPYRIYGARIRKIIYFDSEILNDYLTGVLGITDGIAKAVGGGAFKTYEMNVWISSAMHRSTIF